MVFGPCAAINQIEAAVVELLMLSGVVFNSRPELLDAAQAEDCPDSSQLYFLFAFVPLCCTHDATSVR